jgi:hypothetical protein
MKSIAAPTKHTWWFRNVDIDGQPGKWQSHKSKKRYYQGPSFKIILSASMVEKSIKAKGAGDSLRCPGSFCMRDHYKFLKEQMGIQVSDLLYAEWLDSRVIISTKTGKVTDLPEDCLVFSHNQSWFPKLNDDPSGKGAKKLLAMIRENGPIEITLSACKPQTGTRAPGRPAGQNNGTVTAKKRRGTRERFARYMSVGSSRPQKVA